MWLVISGSRGVEYASCKKSNCIKELKRLMDDDIKNGSDLDVYFIEKDDTNFYKEGKQ